MQRRWPCTEYPQVSSKKRILDWLMFRRHRSQDHALTRAQDAELGDDETLITAVCMDCGSRWRDMPARYIPRRCTACGGLLSDSTTWR